MESFADILNAGGHANSLGRSGEVVEILKHDPARLNELYDCIFTDDAWVRMRAVDTFEKLVRDNPNLAAPYLESIFKDLCQTKQPSIQWHIAQIFTEVDLNEDRREHAINWLKDKISTTAVDWIVAVNCMKSLQYFKVQGWVKSDQIKELFEVQLGHKSKSVRKKATQFLKELV